MKKKEKIIIASSIIVTAVGGVLNYLHSNVILSFVVSAGALALLAKVVGDATEQLGGHFGPAATGILQSALGNLPELFVAIFALKAGLNKVVQAALIGSILGNSLLVLGLAIFLGGIKNGTQRFISEPPKMMATLMILALAGLAIPTVTHIFHTPGSTHINQMDIFLAIVLLIIFIASTIVSLKGDSAFVSPRPESKTVKTAWPLAVAVIVLTVAGVAAGFVSDWFVNALKPAMQLLNINDTFAGLVIVAIAGNAIENVVGVQLAYKNQSDYAMSVIMNSSLQVALGLFPLLVLLSFFLGGSILSFVLAPMLLVSLALGVIVSAFVAIAGNAIENVVGVQLAYKNQSDYAMSVIMNSSLQVALGLFPLLVLLSFFLGGSILSFVLAPMLLVSLALGVIVSAFVVFDGESIWLEGLALIGLYLLIAAAFWWG